MFAWIKRKTVGVCIVLALIMFAGSAAAKPAPFSQDEIQSLQKAENSAQSDAIAGDGNDALAAVGIFFIVLILCAAIASSSSSE